MSRLSLLRADLDAVLERDPATASRLEALLCSPGLHAIWLHRVWHALHRRGWRTSARLGGFFTRWLTGVEIHPGASIGRGVFIDHGHGVVIGETAVVGAGAILYQGVTLGGTGKEHGPRHPILEEDVVVGAGARVLGRIRVGRGSRIGANSVVIRDVPPDCTVVGVPGRVARGGSLGPERLEHGHLPDPLLQRLEALAVELDELKRNGAMTRKADHYEI